MPARTERDSIGEIEIPDGAQWGPQTERARRHFAIGNDRFPTDFLVDYLRLKRAAAAANVRSSVIPKDIGAAIDQAATDLIEGDDWTPFPLSPYQSGSGTQLNMNVNEVIAYRARLPAGLPVHPNDHVNASQSTNDTFPTVMHMTVLARLEHEVVPAFQALGDVLERQANAAMDIVKLGRTHMMDAVPMRAGSEIAGWSSQCRDAAEGLATCFEGLRNVPLGGTAVGTGLNSPEAFAETVLDTLRTRDGIDLAVAPNRFAAMSSHDALVRTSGMLKTAAVAAHAIASNVRLLASGPRGAIAELELPANEPGSSIMPGKINPTQCEALTMVCARVIGNDATVSFAGAQGHLQLNVYKPVIAVSILESMRLLADGVTAFARFCAAGLTVNETQASAHLERSRATVTALAPAIGYELAAKIAQAARHDARPLRDIVLEMTDLTAETYAQLTDLDRVSGPGETSDREQP